MARTTIATLAAPFDRDVERSLSRIGAALRKIEERCSPDRRSGCAPLLGRARAAGASLLVLPECALGGYLGDEEPVALDPAGPEIAALARLAGDTVICAGFVEAGVGAPYSSAVCVSGDGVLGLQRKVHLPPSEIGHFQAGEGFSAFDTPVGRLGMLVCYDKVFPEAARSLALDGAEIVASMAAWPVCRVKPSRRVSQDRQTRQFDLLDQARAVENQVVWVSSNQTGRLGGLRFLGSAKVVDPEGHVLARTTARAGMATARVDIAGAVLGARSLYSHLGDRRPASYRAPDAGMPLPALGALAG